MRIALPADYDRIEQITHDQFAQDWGASFVEAGPGQVGGFREKLTMPGVLVCCADDVSSFVLTFRNGNEWQIVWVFPRSVDPKPLLIFAAKTEHALRPLTGATVTIYLSTGNAEEIADLAKYRLLFPVTTKTDTARLTTTKITRARFATAVGVILA